MNFLQNTFAVLVGLAVAALLISFGVRLNSDWITYEEFAPFKHWRKLLIYMQYKPYFFVALLISSGIGASIGGVVTAILVKHAKVAYALLIGFILLFIAMLDIIIFPYHPTFYKIFIFLTFFPFSWIGVKITEVIYNRKKKQRRQP
jgi:predicted MFS family arabinose efflux permease